LAQPFAPPYQDDERLMPSSENWIYLQIINLMANRLA
jgi:hypothetical protein